MQYLTLRLVKKEVALESCRVLLVDSAENARRFYTLALRSQGYEVVVSPTIEGVEEVIEAYEPAVAVLDMKLTGASAYDLCGKWRKAYPQLAILLLAERDNAVQPVEQRWAVSRGATDLIRKHPDQVETLVLRVNQLARSLSSVDRSALLSALQSLRPASIPVPAPPAPTPPQLIPHPSAESDRSRNSLLGGLQQVWNTLQTRVPTPEFKLSEPKPEPIEEDPNEIVIRYRGTVVRRIRAVELPEVNVSPASPTVELTHPPTVERPTETSVTPIMVRQVDAGDFLDKETEQTDPGQPRKRRQRDKSYQSLSLKSRRF